LSVSQPINQFNTHNRSIIVKPIIYSAEAHNSQSTQINHQHTKYSPKTKMLKTTLKLITTQQLISNITTSFILCAVVCMLFYQYLITYLYEIKAKKQPNINFRCEV